MGAPRILIIAGPNGAGKTTFAKTFLPAEADCIRFLNADLIAAGLSPFKPEEMAASSQAGESFAFETMLSGLSYIQHIKKWRKLGYRISLFFLALVSADLAVERVAQRVQQGGHNIPEDVIRRRFATGLNNFRQYYCPLVNSWTLYDNSKDKPNLIEWGENNGCE